MELGSKLWTLQIMMFLLVAAGLVLSKKGILKSDGKSILTDLVLYFCLPCSIIQSFRMEFSLDMLQKFAWCLTIAIMIQIIGYILSRILYNHKSKEVRQVMQYCTLVSNSGFLGLPIAEGIFGAEGMMYASIFIVPMRIVMWTAGISCYTEAPDFKQVLKKLMLHPCIIAVEIGLALLIFQAPLNGVYDGMVNGIGGPFGILISVIFTALDKAVRSAGGCTTPLTMLLIGMMMVDVKFRDMLNLDVIFITILRLCIFPVIAIICCRLTHMEPLIMGVSVIISGMPAGSTAAILAAKYDCDYRFATKCIVVSTLLSLISVPLWRMLL